MKDYEPALSFGHEMAARYDEVQRFSATPSRQDRDATIAFLAERAHSGPVLELAIGTGWIALPLAATGLRVDGIELSQAMVDRLREKPGGDALAVTIGDMADVAVDGPYTLVYVVANSFSNLLTQDDQVRCFENVAAHLTDGGLFVVELHVPAYLYRRPDLQHVAAESVELDTVRLDVSRHDPVRQLEEESHVTLSNEGVRLDPVVTRYVWPAELDLMARIAGLHLKERWGGWKREPFTAASTHHVSVYGR